MVDWRRLASSSDIDNVRHALLVGQSRETKDPRGIRLRVGNIVRFVFSPIARRSHNRRADVRVLMISTLFHPYLGGMEKQALTLAAQLVKLGVGVTIITRRLPGTPRDEVIDGVSVHRCVTMRPSGVDPFHFIGCLWSGFRMRKEYDVIHAYQPFSSLIIGSILKFATRRPLVLKVARGGSAHGEINMALRSRIGRPFVRKILSDWVDIYVCISEEISSDIVVNARVGDNRIFRVPNGVDCQKYHPMNNQTRLRTRKRLGINETTRIVLCVSRLEPVKGIEFLIQSWKDVARTCDDSLLLIVGLGSQTTHLRILAENLGVSNSCNFIGERTDISEIMAISDVFVLPSLSEGMSNSVLEAMSTGLPVVVTEVGANAELVTDSVTGMLVPTRSPEHITLAITNLLTDKEKASAIGCRARQFVCNNYSHSSVTLSYLRMYRRLASAR